MSMTLAYLRCGLAGVALMALGGATMGQLDGATPLHVAAATGAIAEVRALLAAGVAVDAVDGQGRTALLLAVAEDRVGVARVLLEAGASPNVQAANRSYS
jgi:ankyrin repeat protein